MDLSALLKQNFTQKQSYIETNRLEAWRLYNNSEGWLPLAIDIMKGKKPGSASGSSSHAPYAVLHVFEEIDSEMVQEIEKVLQELLPVAGFFYKDRRKEKRSPLPENPSEHQEIIVEEYGHKFLLNLSDYLDTGLFLDHRETRRFIAEKAAGKIVLNTFAYTGSFSVYAGKAGAKKTYSVDLSKTYCDWIRKNLDLNSLPPEQHWIYKMDTMEFFRYARRKNLQFDIIVIDPPTFSKNKGKNFSVQRDHVELLNSAAEVLAPGGFILFSNNYRDFGLDRKHLLPNLKASDLDFIPGDFEGPRPHRAFLVERKADTKTLLEKYEHPTRKS